ncbi:MAG: nucleoside phosphorylase [Chloroflexi bacterium]|nr:nucleoside phosphorylase [Chloroflexota bacterium]MBI3040518.1 nucleoside phosphorylase [Chloroflexota bacterium]MBI3930686.1 nucleoside phosphorylase [Chloroflexota bacterium]
MYNQSEQIPLAEFDADKTAIIEPTSVIKGTSPTEHCVMPIYGKLIAKLKNDGRLEKVHEFETVSLPPIEAYKLNYEGKPVIVANPGSGAPLVAGIFEELIAFGCRKFVACGSAGVLKPELKRGAIVIPGIALRDEGTSYHYCLPSRLIEMDAAVVRKLESVLLKHAVKYEIGKTWTTDGFYRETKGKVARRKSEGCLTVEMECSALVAVARFRNVLFGQYLAAGDDISGKEWNPRYVDNKLPFQEKVFWLSVEACLNL